MSYEDDLACTGFYAFGGGYAGGDDPEAHGESLYCNECPLREECWTKHRRRVARLMPWLVATFNRYREMATSDREAVARFRADFDIPDPFNAVMIGNFEDGLARGQGEEPPARESTRTLEEPPLGDPLPEMLEAELYDGRTAKVEADLDAPILHLYTEGEGLEVRIEDVGEVIERRPTGAVGADGDR